MHEFGKCNQKPAAPAKKYSTFFVYFLAGAAGF